MSNIHARERYIPGYTMIEISLSLIVISILGITMLFMQRYYYKKHMDYITHTRQMYVMKALGQYAGTHSCLPYPCIPKQYNNGMQQTPTTTANQHRIQSTGYVPWRTLGIPQEYSMDAYRKPFIYVMNPLLGERTDFEPFPDSDLLTLTDLTNQYTFFFMNNNHSLDIVSDDHYDFIELTYKTRDGELKTINMNNSTQSIVYKLGNVIPHDKMCIYHKNGKPIIRFNATSPTLIPRKGKYIFSTPEKKHLQYLLHKLYNSPYLQIETIELIDTKSDKKQISKKTIFRYNPPTTQHYIKNCIAYVLIAGNDEQKILAQTKKHPLTNDKIQIHLSDKVMFVTRFDIAAFNGPCLLHNYINLKAIQNLRSALYHIHKHPYLPSATHIVQGHKISSDSRVFDISYSLHAPMKTYHPCETFIQCIEFSASMYQEQNGIMQVLRALTYLEFAKYLEQLWLPGRAIDIQKHRNKSEYIFTTLQYNPSELESTYQILLAYDFQFAYCVPMPVNFGFRCIFQDFSSFYHHCNIFDRKGWDHSREKTTF